ncbi:MAG: hypothetical protein M3619_04565 [Myxococcota bacterium]|nr:hypothetical protein [Myxococcota bacterium]
MSKKTASTTKAKKPTRLDEKTSALVIAEYLAIGKVTTKEIDEIMDGSRPLSPREVAVAFRVSEVLDIPAPFTIAPRYRLAFARAQEYLRVLDAASAAVAS